MCVRMCACACVCRYTQANWDNPPPASADKNWAQLTDSEKATLTALGYVSALGLGFRVRVEKATLTALGYVSVLGLGFRVRIGV